MYQGSVMSFHQDERSELNLIEYLEKCTKPVIVKTKVRKLELPTTWQLGTAMLSLISDCSIHSQWLMESLFCCCHAYLCTPCTTSFVVIVDEMIKDIPAYW